MEEKKLHAEPFQNIRQAVEFINTIKVPREDFLGILLHNGQVFVTYYK